MRDNLDLSGLQALFKTRRPDVTERAVRQYLVDAPQNARLHALLSLALSQQRRYAEAADAAEQSLRLDPHYAYAHHTRALALLAQHRLPGAAESLAEALHLNPRMAGTWALRAWLHHDQGRYAAGLTDAETALALDPTNLTALRYRTACLRRLKRFGEARESAQQWLRTAPTDSDAQLAAGHAALHFHQPTQAEEHLVEAVRLDPTDRVARQQLARAYQNRYRSLRWANAYDAHYNGLIDKLRRGQFWAFGLILVEALGLGLLAVLMLPWLGLDYLRWRWSTPIQRLLELDEAGVRQRRRNWGVALLVLTKLGLIIGAGVWICLRLNWSLSWVGTAMVAILAAFAFALREEEQQLRP